MSSTPQARLAVGHREADSRFLLGLAIFADLHLFKILIPRALILGTILVGVFYLALNFVFLFGADPESIRDKNDVAAIAAHRTRHTFSNPSATATDRLCDHGRQRHCAILCPSSCRRPPTDVGLRKH